MLTPRRLSPLLLALTIATAGVRAQPAATEATDSPPPAPERREESAAPPPPAGGREDSPFDYRPSEEISEDLPVSFPVDI